MGIGIGTLTKKKTRKLELADHGVRKYDSDIGRFTSIDPLWEKYYSWAPYQYAGNNPITFLDENGEKVIACDEQSQTNIRNSVEAGFQEFIVFDANGVTSIVGINVAPVSLFNVTGELNDMSNLQALNSLIKSDETFNYHSVKEGHVEEVVSNSGSGTTYLTFSDKDGGYLGYAISRSPKKTNNSSFKFTLSSKNGKNETLILNSKKYDAARTTAHETVHNLFESLGLNSIHPDPNVNQATGDAEKKAKGNK